MLGRWDQQDLLKDWIGGRETEKGVKTDFRLWIRAPRRIKLPLSGMEKTVDGAGHFEGEGEEDTHTSSSTAEILSLKCLLNTQVRFRYTVRHTCLAIMGGLGLGMHIWKSSGPQ